MSKILRLLIVEDSEDDALLLTRELRRGGYELVSEQVDTAPAMKAALDRQTWDIIISDYAMPQFSAPQALAVMKEKGLDLPFIIVSGTIGEQNAVAALLAGAHDFIIKDNLARLIPAIERELRDAEVRRSKRAADKALHESEARYRLLFDSNPLPLWVFDLESLAFLAVNSAAIQHYGYSQDEFLSMVILDIHLGEDIPTLLHYITQSESESRETVIWRHRKKDGMVIDVEVTGYDLQFGSRDARLVSSHDITERKRAELKLQHYNQRLQTLHAIDRAILTGESLEIIYHFTLEHFIAEVSVWGTSIMIFDPNAEEASVFALYNDNEKLRTAEQRFTLKMFPEENLRALREGKTRMLDNMVDLLMPSPEAQRIPTGEKPAYGAIPLIAHGELFGSLNLGVMQADHLLPEYFEIAHEVADQLAIAIQQARFREQIQRHAAELEQRVIDRTAELQHTKDHVEAILNNSSDAIILASFDGVIQQVNPAFNTLFGYPTDQILGQSILSLVNAHDIEPLLNALKEVVNTRKPARVEIVAAHQDETLFDVDIVMAAIVRENKIKDVVCGLRDITERKRMEQGLRTALEKEKELNELKSRFTSMVSHEFRTPLAVILSSTGLLQRYSDRMPQAKREEHLDQIQTQVGRLVGLLEDVLTLSRAEALGVEMTGENLNLQHFCNDIVVEIQQTTQKHRIRYSVSGASRPLMLDAKLIRQAITNLLSNAVKYAPDGGTITVDLIYESEHVSIRIQDEGIGIPLADQKHLFEVFHRAKNVGNIPGTGLGLPIVKRAVEVHGGTVNVESETGLGTTFTIRLPLEANSEGGR